MLGVRGEEEIPVAGRGDSGVWEGGGEKWGEDATGQDQDVGSEEMHGECVEVDGVVSGWMRARCALEESWTRRGVDEGFGGVL